MRSLLAAVALALACLPLRAQVKEPTTPGAVWLAAWSDAQRLGTAAQYVRYLSLSGVPHERRAELAKVINGHVNSLSTEPDLVPCLPVNAELLRINLKDYDYSVATWDKLAAVEPWYHVDLETRNVWQGGKWKDGKSYAKGSFTEVRKTRAFAPWLPAAAATGLVALTQSQAPIVRADWFLAQTAIQEGKTPGYYDFLGIKDQKTFEKVVRFSEALASRLEQRRAVIFSGITLQPRRLERIPTVLGGLWRTFDSANAVDKHNPLRVLDTLDFDATEQFAPLPNGMPAWLLANSKGVLQTHAPDNVVGGDRTTSSNDTRLHISLSCIRCHLTVQERGVKDIDAVSIGRLTTLDYDTLRELRRQYLRDVGPQMAADRAGYDGAIFSITGLPSAEYARLYGQAFSAYEDAHIDLAQAAFEWGYSAESVKAGFARYDAATKDGTDGLDAVLSILLNGGRIPRRQMEEINPTAYKIMASQ